MNLFPLMTPEEQAARIRKLSRSGLSDSMIATLTGRSVNDVRRTLSDTAVSAAVNYIRGEVMNGRINPLERLRVEREVKARIPSCEVAGIRGNRIRLAALRFVDEGDIAAHGRLMSLSHELDEGQPVDPLNVLRLVLGDDTDPAPLFGIGDPSPDEAASFIREVGADWYALQSGLPIEP